MSFQKYDKNGEIIRNRVFAKIDPDEIPRVEQSHERETNINNIVKRHGGDLIAKTQNIQQLQYDDVTTNDFQESMNLILKGNQTFMSLPSKTRDEFQNDPAKYMDYIHNPENKQALIDRGWMKPPEPEPQPIEVVVTNPVEPPPTE